MGMSASNLKNLDEIHLVKFNIVYELAEAVIGKEFLNSLKSQQSLFNANLVACIVDERLVHSRNLDGAEGSVR